MINFTRLIKQFLQNLNHDTRFAGWMACENMVIKRIKEHYPDKYDEMYEKLVR